jgi:hypothetical protein
VNDVLFISRVAFRLEMAKDFREGQDCQRAVLFVLSPLKTDSRGATILLRCVCRELFGVEELVLDTVPRFLKLLCQGLNLDSIYDGHLCNRRTNPSLGLLLLDILLDPLPLLA